MPPIFINPGGRKRELRSGAALTVHQQADDYVLNTVFLAAASFFAGIASRFA
jgi:hypothetical protein